MVGITRSKAIDQTTLNWLKTWSQSPYCYGYSAMVSTFLFLSSWVFSIWNVCVCRTIEPFFYPTRPTRLHWSMSQFGMVDQLLAPRPSCPATAPSMEGCQPGGLAEPENRDFFGGDKKKGSNSQKAREKRWKTSGPWMYWEMWRFAGCAGWFSYIFIWKMWESNN